MLDPVLCCINILRFCLLQKIFFKLVLSPDMWCIT
jgi:hypothetical protein